MTNVREELEKARDLYKQQEYEQSEQIYTDMMKLLKSEGKPDQELLIEAIQGRGDSMRAGYRARSADWGGGGGGSHHPGYA